MNGYSDRSRAAALSSVLLLAAVALAGCATTGGAATSASAMGHAVRPLDVTTPTAYVVCSGGNASRFPERETVGRVCKPSSSLVHAIY